MDWADLFANRYNSLWPNALWFAAQRCMAAMSRALGQDGAPYLARAEDIRFKINTLLWFGPEVRTDLSWIERHRKEWLYPVRLATTVLQERPHYLPYMGFREYGDRFDTFGNLVTVLFGLASEAQTCPDPRLHRLGRNQRAVAGQGHLSAGAAWRTRLARVLPSAESEPASSLPQRWPLAFSRRLLRGRPGQGRTSGTGRTATRPPRPDEPALAYARPGVGFQRMAPRPLGSSERIPWSELVRGDVHLRPHLRAAR